MQFNYSVLGEWQKYEKIMVYYPA